MIFTNLQFMPQVLIWVGIRILWWGTPPVYSILVKERFCYSQGVFWIIVLLSYSSH